MKVTFFAVLIAGLGFIFSHIGVDKYNKLREETEKINSASQDDRYKLSLFRDQRNWWISLSNFVLWLVCWRLAGLVEKKEQALKELTRVFYSLTRFFHFFGPFESFFFEFVDNFESD